MPNSAPPGVDSFDARRNREAAKALEKYGEEALAPGGQPEFDILDYMINELVGLTRYAEMLRARFGEQELCDILLTGGGGGDLAPVKRAEQMRDAAASEMEHTSIAVGTMLINLRRSLQEAGADLGTPEEY